MEYDDNKTTRITQDRRSGLRFGGALAALFLSGAAAFAQGSGERPPGAPDDEVNPKVVPGLVKPNQVQSGRKGPLASLADRAADEGFTFHAISANFFEANPTSGLRPGHVENSTYNILGVDYDLSKRLGLTGASLHYETTLFTFSYNPGFLGQIGDTMLGFQGTANIKPATISVATFEQKLLGDRLDFEIGRTNAFRYYGLPQCQSLDSCFQDIFFYNAGFVSPLYSVWGTNLSYKITPELYVQAGAFGDNGNPRVGYAINEEIYKGVLGIAEIGRKTSFDTDLYPSIVSLTGFFNTSPHADLNRFSALTPTRPIGSQTAFGTSGTLLQAQKIVWRADGGRNAEDKTPTAINLYASAGTGLDSTTPILAHIFAGATLQSPFAGRPADRFGVKFAYERINDNYAQYLAAANFISGGTGARFNPNKYVAELNAHIQLPAGLAFEPVLQYAWNLNSFYNPLTAARPRDGIYVCGVLIIPVGALLGLVAS